MKSCQPIGGSSKPSRMSALYSSPLHRMIVRVLTRRGDGNYQPGFDRGDQRGVSAFEGRCGEPGDRHRSLAEHVRRIRLDNAEAILEAKNERTASLYLDGLLDTDEHRHLEADRARAELDHQHARREVERLHLIVRVLGGSEGRQE